MLWITQINLFFWHNCANIICTYLNGHLLREPRKYVLYGLNPGFDWGPCCSLPWAFFLFVLAHLVSCCLLQWLIFHAQALPCQLGGFTPMYKQTTLLHYIIYTQSHISTSHLYYYSLLSSCFFHFLGQAGWPRPFSPVTVTMHALRSTSVILHHKFFINIKVYLYIYVWCAAVLSSEMHPWRRNQELV